MKRNFFYKVLCGFLLGISVFAPGFSGSTIAIIMGIYKDIIRITSNPFKDLKKNIIFCIPLGIGVLISGILFILLFKYLFETYEKATYLLFVGLVAGNIPIIYNETKKYDFKYKYLISGLIAFTLALTLGILATGIGHDSSAILYINKVNIVVGGFLGGVVALIPGMSVSVMLMITGIYNQIIIIAENLIKFNFTHLVTFIIFTLTALLGLVLTSKLIKYTFDKIPALANTTVLGFMIGSLISIFIQSLNIIDPNFNWLLGSTMIIIGLGIAIIFIIIGRKMNVEN